MRKRKMIVCALEEEWIARLLERLRQEEWQTQMIDHAETFMGGAGSVLGHYDTGRRVDGGVSMENERCR